jgi:hypothetical protein
MKLGKKHGYYGKTGQDRNSMNRKRDGNRKRDENRKNHENSGAGQVNMRDPGMAKGSFRYGGKPSGKSNGGMDSKFSYKNKPFEEETLEDVQADIVRIQKEISLEIREIRSLKL